MAQYDTFRGKETSGKWAAEMQYLAGAALAKGALAQILPLLTPAAQATAGATPAVCSRCDASHRPGAGSHRRQARWRAAVEADMTSPYAHSAIVALLDSGAVVDEYQRGLANYHKGNYELAIAAFDRLPAAEPGGRDGAARYYKGLSYLALGETDRGIAELDAFIAKFPDSPLWADAWMAKGTRWRRSTVTAEAIVAYRRLAELRPDAAQAPKALWQAALLQGQPGPQRQRGRCRGLSRAGPPVPQGRRRLARLSERRADLLQAGRLAPRRRDLARDGRETPTWRPSHGPWRTSGWGGRRRPRAIGPPRCAPGRRRGRPARKASTGCAQPRGRAGKSRNGRRRSARSSPIRGRCR